MLATRTARWTALTVLVCLALVAASWFVLISPRRAQAAEVAAQTEALRSQNDILQLKVAELKAQYAELPQKKAELAAVYAQLPASAAMPALVRSLTDLATASGVTLDEVTPSAAVDLPAPTPTAPAATAATQAAAGEAAPADGTLAPGAAAAAPAQDGPRVVQIPVTLTVRGDYFETVSFLKKLQADLPRVYLVTSLKVSSPDTGGDEVTLTVSGNVFALPDVDRTVAGAVNPAAPTTTTAPTTAPTTAGAAPGAAPSAGTSGAASPAPATASEGTTTS